MARPASPIARVAPEGAVRFSRCVTVGTRSVHHSESQHHASPTAGGEPVDVVLTVYGGAGDLVSVLRQRCRFVDRPGWRVDEGEAGKDETLHSGGERDVDEDSGRVAAQSVVCGPAVA